MDHILYSIIQFSLSMIRSFGRAGLFLANVAIVVTQVGTHIVHMLFLSTALATIAPVIPPFAWLLLLSPLFVALSLVPSLFKLRIITVLGLLLLVTVLVTIIVFGFTQIPPGNVIAAQINHAPTDVFIFIGTSVYVFEGINVIPPIYVSMKRKQDCKQIDFFF